MKHVELGEGGLVGEAPAIEARELTKSYGKHRGIEDINLTVERGEVIGLVGANGAGKSTFMRTLLDLIRPTSGTLSVFGEPVAANSVSVRGRCTYLPGEFIVPARLTGYQTLRRFTFTRRNLSQTRVKELTDRLDLDLSRRVRDLSKGNKQKVALILAFAPEPELLVLDEPTSGLDPILQRIFAELVSEAIGRGSTVLLSSHVMSEVEQIADRVALLRSGRLTTIDRVSTLLAGARRRATVHPASPAESSIISEQLSKLPSVSGVSVEDGVISFACQGSVDSLLKVLASFDISALDLAHADLEDAFFADEENRTITDAKGNLK
jgi:ABC-2 type transport system ATP-binding protein